MKTTVYSLKQLLENKAYIDKLTHWANLPASCIKQSQRVAISLMLASLHRQLQTDIGKGLVQRILGKHALLMGEVPDFGLTVTDDFTDLITEGHRLLGTILPGKKSTIMRIIVHYTKLPFKDIDPIMGLSAYILFTRLAFDAEMTKLELPFKELAEFAPELSHKDYSAVGVYSVPSFSGSASIARSAS